MVRRATAFVPMFLLLSGCVSKPLERASSDSHFRADTPVPVTTGVAKLGVDSLMALLPSVQGAVAPADPTVGSFQGDRAVLDAMVSRGDSAVVRLVDCLDRRDTSEVALGQHQLTMGELCYVVLNAVAYYEATGPDGALTADWPGHVALPASAAQLAAAKRAWLMVVKRRSYMLS